MKLDVKFYFTCFACSLLKWFNFQFNRSLSTLLLLFAYIISCNICSFFFNFNSVNEKVKMNIAQQNQPVKQFSRFSHQNLYKSPNRNAVNKEQELNGESPSWRNAYKKRCFDEFKRSRLKLVNKFRSLQVNLFFIKIISP